MLTIALPGAGRFLSALGLAWLAAVSAAAPALGQRGTDTISGQAEVLRGDLLAVTGSTQEGNQEIQQTQQVRLYGIAAPFLNQRCHSRDNAIYPCGEYARDRLETLIGGDEVRCVILDEDTYDRRIGICRTEDWNLNEAMIVFGWAMAYRGLSNNYILLEHAARMDDRGLWAGSVEPPWVWHARNPDRVKYPTDVDRPEGVDNAETAR